MNLKKNLEVISKYLDSNIKDDDWVSIEDTLSEVHFKEGDSPTKQGGYHNFGYIIIKGAARSYYLKEGKEVITWFAFENDVVASLQNYRNKPALESVSFLEDSHCIKIDLQGLHVISKTNISTSHLINSIFEEHIEFLEERLRLLQHNPGIDRYLHILEKEPYLLQRIPLTYLASYLGISRETLSRLRAKISL